MTTPTGVTLRSALAAASAVSLAFALLSAQAHSQTAAPANVKRILVVNSYEQGSIWTDAVVRGLRETLADVPVEYWFQYLDVHRNAAADLAGATEKIRDLAARVRFDAVVASDDAAVTLLADNIDTIAAGHKVVACGVNEPSILERFPPGRVTALTEVYDAAFMPSLAAQLVPGTRRFLVVTDNTRTGASVHQLYRGYAAIRRDIAFEFLDGRQMPLDMILTRVRAAGPGDAILISNFLRDSTERHYPRDAAMSRIASEAGAPVYTTVLSSLGQGVAVGLANRGYQHGAWAGRRVLQLLRDPAASLAAAETEPPGRVVADVRALNRWGIDLRRLPADAILVNEPPSFYRANKRVVWSAVAFALAQTLAVALLGVNVRRRRRAERALLARTEHLEQTLAALEQARVERLEIEERLRQSERLESMGRLAGGIAHDFNNLLTVILSYAEVASAEAPPHSELASNMEQIRLAGNSAADLTRQILAFSRRQVLSPAIVDLNQLAEQSATLIGRLLTEAIEISLRLQPGLPSIRIDQTQVQQVLINLAVNARDAMPDGGTLIIETSAVDADLAYTAAHPTMQPGRYVVLSVTDTGTGMSRDVLGHIFEPFFTTKPQGRGTGLGLASVYGTVKQSGGWIWASSELGQGTTFRIHFPASE